MKYRIKKILKALHLYNFMCRAFLPKRNFIVEPFVYLNKKDEVVKNEITNKIRWLEKYKINTHCIEFAESEFREYSKNKYEYYDAIWLF